MLPQTHPQSRVKRRLRNPGVNAVCLTFCMEYDANGSFFLYCFIKKSKIPQAVSTVAISKQGCFLLLLCKARKLPKGERF